MKNAAARADSQPQRKVAEIVQGLRTSMVDGELKAGARLTERSVSERFSCPGAAVRDAFRLLEKMGAITLSARRGARVIDTALVRPDDVLAVWGRLTRFGRTELTRAGVVPEAWSPAGGARSRRLEAVESRLDRLAQAAASPKLGQILSRAALHVAILAPERFADLERDLAG